MDRERNYQLARISFDLWLEEQSQERQLFFVERTLGRLELDEYPFEDDPEREAFEETFRHVVNEAAWSDLLEGMKMHGFVESRVDSDGELIWKCTPAGAKMFAETLSGLDDFGYGSEGAV